MGGPVKKITLLYNIYQKFFFFYKYIYIYILAISYLRLVKLYPTPPSILQTEVNNTCRCIGGRKSGLSLKLSEKAHSRPQFGMK